MQLTKKDIKGWLKTFGHSRQWLADQCGITSSRSVDNWLSSARAIPPHFEAIIMRLMQDDNAKAQQDGEPKQNLLLEVDVPTFERWSRAALKHNEIITEYAIRAIEEAAKKDMQLRALDEQTPQMRLAAEDSSPFGKKKQD